MASLPASSVSSVASRDAQLAQLTQQMSQLLTEVANLNQQLDHRSRSSSITPRRRQHRAPSNSSGVCWYHQRFGENASKCTSPCTQASNFKGEH